VCVDGNALSVLRESLVGQVDTGSLEAGVRVILCFGELLAHFGLDPLEVHTHPFKLCKTWNAAQR